MSDQVNPYAWDDVEITAHTVGGEVGLWSCLHCSALVRDDHRLGHETWHRRLEGLT